MATSGVDAVLQLLEGWLGLVLLIGAGVIGLFGHKLHKSVLFLFGFVAGTYLGYFLLRLVWIVVKRRRNPKTNGYAVAKIVDSDLEMSDLENCKFIKD